MIKALLAGIDVLDRFPAFRQQP